MSIKNVWGKITKWQKNLALIASIIASVVFIYPYAKATIDTVKVFVEFQKQAIYIEQTLAENKAYIDLLKEHDIILEVDNHDKYLTVMSGVLSSALEKLDNKTYGVELYLENEYTGEMEVRVIEAKLRKTNQNDKVIIIKDNKAKMYSVKWSKDNQRYSYIDFDGNEHQIYEANFVVNIVK